MCRGAIRTRSARGWMVNRRGDARVIASPSAPAGTVPLASTLSDRALHARAARCEGTIWSVDHDDPQLPCVECGTCRASRRAPEGVGVVGDQHHAGPRCARPPSSTSCMSPVTEREPTISSSTVSSSVRSLASR